MQTSSNGATISLAATNADAMIPAVHEDPLQRDRQLNHKKLKSSSKKQHRTIEEDKGRMMKVVAVIAVEFNIIKMPL
jgi:hypothetical protein